MRLLFRSGAWLLLGLLGIAPACSSDANRPTPTGGGGSSGAGGGGLVGCLDQPGALDRPPNGRLPCELIPPGVKL